MKKLITVVLAFLLLFRISASPAEPAVSGDIPSCTVAISEDTDLLEVRLGISPDGFGLLGFRFGDSCDILMPDGSVLQDVPYYNGYYTRTGGLLLVAYPGYEYINLAINNGESSWTAFHCREGDSVTVTLAEAGKYADIQDALNTVYSNDRADYPDDETFANFRAVSVGRMKKNTFYRGASPVNNTYNRAGCTDRLIREAGVRYVIDLADTEESLRTNIGATRPEYLLSLYDAGLVLPLSLGFSFMSGSYQASLASGLREMMKHEGPYYIHCLEGKDRTGFICLLLEALAGADVAELEADYMKTYANYYGIEPGTAKYNAILDVKFSDHISLLSALGGETPEDWVKTYLYRGGMAETEVDALQRLLTGD